MFFDRVTVRVRAGDGGRGGLSFRREKFVPRGGPDGGDGGRGGSIWFVADPELNTLINLKGRRLLRAERGEHGNRRNAHGADGEDVLVRVPAGTTVHDADTGEVICDLPRVGDRFRVARGGRGGRGNAAFATDVQQAPRLTEKGEPGEERLVRLELRSIADIGLVGFPNAGKSTFLAAVSAARPKIADYPFTTLSPNLGVHQDDRHRTLVVADVPGLIEGAAEGAGLGHDFLRHLERTSVLVHLLDGAAGDLAELERRYRAIRHELQQHGQGLPAKPEVVVLNKSDLPGVAARAPRLARRLGVPVLAASARSAAGCEAVVEVARTEMAAVRAARALEPAPVVLPVLRPRGRGARFQVTRRGDAYVLEGAQVERTVVMTDFENAESTRRLKQSLDRWGVTRALEALGARAGDTVLVRGVEFTFEP
ncbi:MAG: GTPase ObgE [Candidatus Dormibacteria bacterium]